MLNKLPANIRPIPGRPACPLPKPGPGRQDDNVSHPPRPRRPGDAYNPDAKVSKGYNPDAIKAGGPFKVEEGSELYKQFEKLRQFGEKHGIKVGGPFKVEEGSELAKLIEKYLQKKQ